MKEIFSDLYKKVMSFFNNEAKEENSKKTACNRLKLVLMQDRAKMEPALMEKMREEMIEVISKYVEIDKEALDLNIEAEGYSFALMLNIPVLRAKTREEIETQEGIIIKDEDEDNDNDNDNDNEDNTINEESNEESDNNDSEQLANEEKDTDEDVSEQKDSFEEEDKNIEKSKKSENSENQNANKKVIENSVENEKENNLSKESSSSVHKDNTFSQVIQKKKKIKSQKDDDL